MQAPRSPLALFLIVAISIFTGEVAVMFALPASLPASVEALVDAGALVAVLFPVLYLFVLRPMSRGAAERDRLIEELREKEAFNAMVVDTAVDAFIVTDESGTIQSFNHAATEMFGHAASEVVGRNVGVLTPARDREQHDGHVARWRAGGSRGVAGMSREVTALHRSGEEFPAELAVSEFAMRGRRYSMGVVRDMSERKRTESALHAARTELEARVEERTAELARTVAMLEERNGETAQLAELGEMLHGCTKVDEACAAIRHAGARLFPGTRGALYGFSPSRDDLELLTAWGDGTAEQAGRILDPGACWALRRGRVHRNQELCAAMPCSRSACGEPMLCIPMTAQGETLGVLNVRANAEAGAAGAEPAAALATAVAEQVALALANLKLRETLRLQSIVDPLTGLFNRRFMEETLARELSRAERSGHDLAVIVLDIDHFKRFNDTSGHDAGDTLLRGVGKFLRTQVRGSDVACRYGGEEFVLILPEMPARSALERAEAIRAGIGELTMVHQGKALGTVTASLGLACYPVHGSDSDSLLRSADQAMYRSKLAGRDRVTLASEAGEAVASPEREPMAS